MSSVVRTAVTANKVGIITLDRPERRNAVNGALAEQLDAAVKAMAGDDDVKVVVLTGAAPEGGTGGFCSGGDTDVDSSDSAGLALGVPPDARSGDLARHDGHASMLLHQMPKPSIAMVGGPAVGAGFSLAGACDLRFASDDALFRAGFSPNGLTGDYGGSFFWTRIVGTALTRRIYLLNERIGAAQALEWGMVHEVRPAAELRDFTLEIAATLARTPREALALMKDNLNQAEDHIDRRRWLLANEAENQIAAGRAMRERIARKRRA